MGALVSRRLLAILAAISQFPNSSVAQEIDSYNESKRAFLFLLESADSVEVIDFRFVGGEQSSTDIDFELMSIMNGNGYKQSCRSNSEGEQYFTLICGYYTKFTNESRLFDVGIAFELPKLKVEYSDTFNEFVFNCVEPDCISIITNLYSSAFIAARASTLKVGIYNINYIRGFARSIQNLRQHQPLHCNSILSDC